MNFIPGWFPVGAVAARTPPSLTYVGITKSAAAAQNFSFAGVNIGPAAATRRLIVALAWENSVAHRTISSFTMDIGGGPVSMGADLVHAIASPGFQGGDVAFYSILAPTGGSALFQVNTSGTNVHMSMSVFNALNETVASPHAAMTDGTLSGNTLSGNINIPANGWLLAVSNGFGSPTPGSMNWTGVTPVYQDVLGTTAIRTSGATENLLPVQAGRAVAAVIPAATAGQTGSLAAMSWG